MTSSRRIPFDDDDFASFRFDPFEWRSDYSDFISMTFPCPLALMYDL